jgi:carbamoyltransferase
MVAASFFPRTSAIISQHMIVLGFNGSARSAEEDDENSLYMHDAAAVLMQDGKLISAMEEERLNRLKHTNCFPSSAIRYCLDNAGIGWDEVDCIVKVAEEKSLAFDVQWQALLDNANPIPRNAAEYVAQSFMHQFGVDVTSKLRFCDHHDAHLWSTFAQSGFDDALVVSIDGVGDGRSGAIYVGRKNSLTEVRRFGASQSLGFLYAGIIRLLGLGSFDEYKAMGLAPYGDPLVYQTFFDGGYKLLPDGDYAIDNLPKWFARFDQAGFVQKARRSQEPFLPFHMNIAAGLQQMLERIVMHVLASHQKQTGQTNLCMAGGVAHNCTLNGIVLRSGLFERVFVQPAAHDAGGALGAACWATATSAPNIAFEPMTHVYFGPDVSDDDNIKLHLDPWSDLVDIQFQEEIAKEAAALLASGSVIGWVQGRSEFGPRALGNRSILADPRPANNKDLINLMVKKREQFRPFAPSVIEERASEFFEIPDCPADLGFMTYVLRVRETYRSALGAVTHTDGTARIQTVSRNVNSRYWELLKEFEGLTGIPILLNTSFNNNAEPIVDSIADAVACFLTTGLNYLVLGRYLVSKRFSSKFGTDSSNSNSEESLLNLIPSLPPIRRLLQSRRSGQIVHKIEGTKCSVYSRRSETEVSDAMFRLLSRANDRSTVNDLLERTSVQNPHERRKLSQELLDLWSKRMIALTPPGAAPSRREV